MYVFACWFQILMMACIDGNFTVIFDEVKLPLIASVQTPLFSQAQKNLDQYAQVL